MCGSCGQHQLVEGNDPRTAAMLLQLSEPNESCAALHSQALTILCVQAAPEAAHRHQHIQAGALCQPPAVQAQQPAGHAKQVAAQRCRGRGGV